MNERYIEINELSKNKIITNAADKEASTTERVLSPEVEVSKRSIAIEADVMVAILKNIWMIAMIPNLIL